VRGLRPAAESTWSRTAPPRPDDLLMYGLPENFSLTSFHGAMLISVQLGQHQVNLEFDGHNRGLSIESRYAVVAPGGEAEQFTEAPAGAAALAALLGDSWRTSPAPPAAP
jgi:hypothetical protein